MDLIFLILIVIGLFIVSNQMNTGIDFLRSINSYIEKIDMKTPEPEIDMNEEDYGPYGPA